MISGIKNFFFLQKKIIQNGRTYFFFRNPFQKKKMKLMKNQINLKSYPKKNLFYVYLFNIGFSGFDGFTLSSLFQSSFCFLCWMCCLTTSKNVSLFNEWFGVPYAAACHPIASLLNSLPENPSVTFATFCNSLSVIPSTVIPFYLFIFLKFNSISILKKKTFWTIFISMIWNIFIKILF